MPINGCLKRRILLVDDDRTFSDILRDQLEARGFAVDSVYNSAAAMACLCAQRDHFCIFDLHLETVDYPAPDGVKLVAKLIEEWPKHAHDSWVILTSDTSDYTAIEQVRLLHPKNLGQKFGAGSLADWIEKRFYELTPHNWLLAISDSVAAIELTLPDGTILDSRQTLGELEELLRLLFLEESTVSVALLDEQGFSDTVLFQAVPPTEGGEPRWFVVKIGHHSLTDREKLNIAVTVRRSAFPGETLGGVNWAGENYAAALDA